MLVLRRIVGERILLETSDGPIWIELTESHGRYARIGITAPKDVRVMREELLSPQTRAKEPS